VFNVFFVEMICPLYPFYPCSSSPWSNFTTSIQTSNTFLYILYPREVIKSNNHLQLLG